MAVVTSWTSITVTIVIALSIGLFIFVGGGRSGLHGKNYPIGIHISLYIYMMYQNHVYGLG